MRNVTVTSDDTVTLNFSLEIFESNKVTILFQWIKKHIARHCTKPYQAKRRNRWKIFAIILHHLTTYLGYLIICRLMSADLLENFVPPSNSSLENYYSNYPLAHIQLVHPHTCPPCSNVFENASAPPRITSAGLCLRTQTSILARASFARFVFVWTAATRLRFSPSSVVVFASALFIVLHRQRVCMRSAIQGVSQDSTDCKLYTSDYEKLEYRLAKVLR